VARPLPCSYDALLKSDANTVVVERRTVLERLHHGMDEARGNFCPAGSSVPSSACRAGHYCPAPAQQLPCERGHYCPAGSVHQRRCHWLASCPPGTTRPKFSYAALLLAAAVLVAAMWVWRALSIWDRAVGGSLALLLPLPLLLLPLLLPPLL
jgi:hypothetical protein